MNSKNSTSRSTSESSTMKGQTMSTKYTRAKNYQTIIKHGFIYSFGYIMCWRGKVWYTYGRITGTTLDEYISTPF